MEVPPHEVADIEGFHATAMHAHAMDVLELRDGAARTQGGQQRTEDAVRLVRVHHADAERGGNDPVYLSDIPPAKFFRRCLRACWHDLQPGIADALPEVGHERRADLESEERPVGREEVEQLSSDDTRAGPEFDHDARKAASQGLHHRAGKLPGAGQDRRRALVVGNSVPGKGCKAHESLPA